MYGLNMQYVAVERFVPIGYSLIGPKKDVPLVICHGLGAYHIQWETEARQLAQSRPVLTIDLRGHGASAVVRNGQIEDYSLERMARDVIGVIEHCGFDRVHFLGNSLGGMIGLEIARTRPDLLRSLVTCGTAFKFKLSPLVVWTKLVIYYLLGRRLPKFIARHATINEAMRPLVEEMYANASRKVMHLIDRQIYIFDRLETAQAFEGHLIVMRGERDTTINRYLDRSIEVLKNKINFHVIDLPGVGHFTNLDQPALFQSCLKEALDRVEESAENACPPS
ncbi:alpha/beta hydrolase [Parasphingorhabdus litoris]|uniref:Alpha/beta hydrolase n=1 Tax=Parasphingorhabdus litoris TaxID=394733 RepID=A0ABN1AL04_9SPHN|nr:alpha/beta hydrolase [Parasphingorhabdus litoris]